MSVILSCGMDSNLNHGSEHNTKNKSRVSVDFRVLPKSKYQDNDMVNHFKQN